MSNLLWIMPIAFAVGFYIGYLRDRLRRAERGRYRAEQDALSLCARNQELCVQTVRLTAKLDRMTAYQTNAARNAPHN